MGTGRTRALGLASLLLFCIAGSLVAQDLDPRAYSVAPLGTNIAVAVYSHLHGSVLFDESLPITDAKAAFDVWGLGYFRSIDFFGRTANVRAVLPYMDGNAQGFVSGQFASVDKKGLGDFRGQLSVNVLGAPAMTRAELPSYRPTTGVYASLTFLAPTGTYDSTKLINIGNNRWAFKPELAVVQPLGRWTLEGYAGVWLFTTNHDFYGGHTRSQDPMYAFQGHVSYTFRPGLWAGADATLYTGGDTTLDGVAKNDRQNASRAGVVASWAFLPGQAIKAQYTRTTTVRVGGRFEFLSLAYTYSWFDK